MVRTLVTAAALLVMVSAPALAAAQAKAAGQTSAKPPVTGTININTASAADLQRLPGIGAKTAGRVIEYRQKNGPFKKVEEILEIDSSCPYLLRNLDGRAPASVSRSR